MAALRASVGSVIIDSHIHFFDRPRPGAGPTHERDHLTFDDVLAQARECGIDRVVQVTPVAVGYDNSYSLAMAEQRPDAVHGVIARLDVVAPDIERQLRALREHPKALVLRITLIDKHNEAWLAQGALDGFFELAQQFDVPIELFAPYRVTEMHDAVRRFPGVRWLIDHMGLRYYAGKDNTDAFRQWGALLDLAEETNAWIKCSYFPEAAKDLEDYPFPKAQNYLRQLYERVGADRLIWGSNFPNVRRACTYRQALDFIRVECSFLNDADRKAILGENFVRYASR
jgi:predicted TIM-barrel fold metal-dependent hydrolase